MDITLDSIIGILSLLLGGGMGGFFTWRYQRAKAKWEAKEKQAAAIIPAISSAPYALRCVLSMLECDTSE